MGMQQLDYPFTIQCKSCKSILSDSFSLNDYKFKILFLNNIKGFSLSSKKEKSSSILDKDSIFKYILCNCTKRIGKFYLKACNSLKEYENIYCINVEDVIIYKLGEGKKLLSIVELSDEVNKLQKFCVSLYNMMIKNSF